MKFTITYENEIGQETTYQTQRHTIDVQQPENKRWTLKDVQGKRKPSRPSHSRSLNRSTDLWAKLEREQGSVHRSIRYI